MADIVGIAGLTIAIVDQLLKLGERTVELISNFRDFDADTRRIQCDVNDENNRTRALRLLLFEKSPVYGGRTLFEQFDEDVQSQIRILIEELISVIGQAHQILDPHASYSSLIPSHQSQLETNLSSLSTKTFISWKPTDASRKATTSINRWRWSLWDKKRVSTIVKNFVNLNNRIHGNIKLWCLCTSVGINPQHLTRLRDEESSKQLGFNNDAVMQLAATDLQMTDMSLELRDRELHLGAQRSALLEGRFRMFDWGQAPVFVEYRRHLAGIDNHQGLMDHRTKIRVEKLARLLHQPKEQVFRTPSCIGWLVDPINNDIGFVYAVPQATGMPMSLLRAFDIKDLRASLGQKFRLAHELARCVSQLQLVKWLHESFRSDSILLFPRDYERQGGPSGVTTSLDYSQPWVLGFEFSRAEDDVSLGINDPCLERDVYRHPDRQRAPTKHFTKLHDIYALGVVLLEIGLWQSAISMDKYRFSKLQDLRMIQKHLIRQAEKHLESRMGEKYQSAVLKCLRGDFGVIHETKEDLRLQEAFRSQVVEVLEKISDVL